MTNEKLLEKLWELAYQFYGAICEERGLPEDSFDKFKADRTAEFESETAEPGNTHS